MSDSTHDHHQERRDAFVKEWGSLVKNGRKGPRAVSQDMKYEWDSKEKCFRISCKLDLDPEHGFPVIPIEVVSPRLNLEEYEDEASRTRAESRLELDLLPLVEQKYHLAVNYNRIKLPKNPREAKAPNLGDQAAYTAQQKFVNRACEAHSRRKYDLPTGKYHDGGLWITHEALDLFYEWNGRKDVYQNDTDNYIYVDACYASSKIGGLQTILGAHIIDKSGADHSFEAEMPADGKGSVIRSMENALPYFISMYVNARQKDFCSGLNMRCYHMRHGGFLGKSFKKELKRAASAELEKETGLKYGTDAGSDAPEKEKQSGDFFVRVVKGKDTAEYSISNRIGEYDYLHDDDDD